MRVLGESRERECGAKMEMFEEIVVATDLHRSEAFVSDARSRKRIDALGDSLIESGTTGS